MAIVNLLEQVDHFLSQSIELGYMHLAHAVLPSVNILVAISFVIIGYAMFMGYVVYPMSTLVANAVKIACVLSLLHHWSTFALFFVELFANTPKYLASALFVDASTQDINKVADLVLQEVMGHFLLMFHGGLFEAFSRIMVGLMGCTLTLLSFGLATAYLIIVKIMVAVLLTLAPVFLLCLLNSKTLYLAEHWLSHLIGFALSPLAIYAVMLLELKLLECELKDLAMKSATHFGDFANTFLILLLFIPALNQARSLCLAIGAGFSLRQMLGYDRQNNATKPLKRFTGNLKIN